MSYDKLIDSVQLDSDLTAIANAIRGKTGKTAKLGIDEMPAEIASIETGTTPDTVEQATPTISVSSAGLITASATQTEGFVVGGTKSATKQLSTQAAKTVTPSTSNQTAVASGKYTTGAITVKGDSNLKAANILKGVSIFGVTGSAQKCATGTFTAPFMGGGVTVTVTGVGFTPSKIYIFEDLTEEGYRYDGYVAYLVGTASENFSAFPTTQEVYDEYDEEYYEYIAMETVKDEFTITMNSDGFKLATSRLNGYQFREGATCRYIALA